jgi:DNA-binding NtrC family response regulator
MMMMANVKWTGLTPAGALVAALAARDVHVSSGTDNAIVLAFTPGGARVPQTAGGEPWIWLTRARVSDGQRAEAVTRGAYDVISLADPDAADQIAARVHELETPLPAVPPNHSLALHSEAARHVAEQVSRVAPTSMSVLFTGETGTGKEVMARLMHAWSPRHRKPFIPINCAAIPNELMEAELFGYARGAFSGAVQKYDGQLMAAEGGTVFLDEIDETPLETQVKLLRVLDDHVVSRLGENIWHEVDFRLLAATNQDLRTLIDAGLFGGDLYERLAIVTIHLAPLRERVEDLPDLARHFMERFAREQARPVVTGLRPDARRVLEAYPWPGNIRELRNVLYETLVYKRAGDDILLSDLPKRILRRSAEARRAPVTDRSLVASKIARGTMNLKEEVAELQRIAVGEALARTNGNAAQAARLLGTVGRGVARDPGGTMRAMMRRLDPPVSRKRGRTTPGDPT